MTWQRFLKSGPLTLLAYLAVNVLVIMVNPAKFITQTTDFLGQPVGDLSDDFRLHLSNKKHESNVEWELDSEVCGFTWYWNTLNGTSGHYFNQSSNLCVRNSSVDWYTIEGVDSLSPVGVEGNCDELVSHQTAFHGYTFTTVRYCELGLTAHYFGMSRETADLGLHEGASATDVELLFSTGSHHGVYEWSEPSIKCDEPVEDWVDCTLLFSFWDERAPNSEVRNSTFEVRSSILSELKGLAGRDWLPHELSQAGLEVGICDAIAKTEELDACSIKCDVSYPYPSSVCIGTYESVLVKEVTHRTAIVSFMTAITVACWLSLWTLRLGMRTAHGRSQRGYLGVGGSSQHFFEEEGDRGDRISLPNPMPPIQVAKVSTHGTTLFPFAQSTFPTCRWEDGETTTCLGIVVCPGVQKIPREIFYRRTGAPIGLGDRKRALGDQSRPGSVLSGGTLPICFVVRENPDGSLTNLDVEEVHRLLDESGGRALLDESFGGEHLAWARGFSVVDAMGCLLTMWTVHFVAANSGWGSFYWVAALVALAKWLEEADVQNLVGLLVGGVQVTPKIRNWSAPPLPITLALMEVLYDLSVPGVEVFGLIVTATWTVIVVVSCGYYIFVLGYEPVYAGGGLYSKKVSLKTALAVGEALKCPFALAGDWVRGSRCGDIGTRLAVSFCLASPERPDEGTRVSHVNFRSELRTTFETGFLCGDRTGRSGM